MKKLIIAILMLAPAFVFAQDKAAKQMYSIHEDQVKPSMTMEYEKICKELVSMLRDNGITEANWLVSVTDDNRYWYTSPVAGWSDMENSPFKALTEKVGKEKMDDLWARMDKCYDKHGSYMISMDTDLTYMPDGIDQAPEGQNWREFHYWHFTPENEEKAWAIAKELKDMTAANNSPLHYRVYRSGFGTVGTYYLVAFAAKDAIDFETRFAKHRELGGESYMKKIQELRALTEKYEEVEGTIRPDLSYKPQTKVSAVKK